MNNKHQISVRLPQSLYLSLQDYIGKHEFLSLTQVTIYAISKYIGHTEPMNNPSVALEIDDLKIDLQDIEKFMENLDRRLTKIEKKNKPKARVTHRLTESQKYSIAQYIKRSLDSGLVITIKEILYYLGLNPDHQGLQQQVAYVLKSKNLTKERIKINGKMTYIWVK